MKDVLGPLHGYSDWLIAQGKSSHTAAAYLSRMKLYFEFQPDHIRGRITQSDVELYLQSLENRSPQTSNQSAYALNAYAEFKQIDVRIKRPRHVPEYMNRKMPSAAEMKKIWRYISKQEEFFRLRDQAIISVLYYAGARIEETRSLSLDDVDLINLQLRILGLKGQGVRYIPINSELKKALRSYLKVRTQLVSTSTALFVSQSRNRETAELTYGSFRCLIRGILVAVKLKHLSPYSFRHAFATNLNNLHLAPEKISALLGHGKRQSPLPYYVVPSKLTSEQALERLPKGVA